MRQSMIDLNIVVEDAIQIAQHSMVDLSIVVKDVIQIT